MLVVFVSASGFVSSNWDHLSHTNQGILHGPSYFHECCCQPRHESYPRIRYPVSYPRINQIPNPWLETCPARRAIDDHDYLGMQNMSTPHVPEAHVWAKTANCC